MGDAKYLGLTANRLAKIAYDLETENAELRELITDVHDALCADKTGIFHRLILEGMEYDMRELGIEVG